MISWKPQAESSSLQFGARFLLIIGALYTVALDPLALVPAAQAAVVLDSDCTIAQNSDPQNGPTRPWADGGSVQASSMSQYPPAQQFGQYSPIGRPPGMEQNYRSYNAPSGGYSPRYYEAPSSGNFSAEGLPPGGLQPWHSPASQGILRWQIPAPTLPEGLVIPIQLDTSIDLDRAEPGDYVQTHLSQNISAGGGGYLQGGSVLSGTIASEAEEKHGAHGRAGKLGIDFVQVRLPNGTIVPLKAHLVGRLANYLYRDTNPRSNTVMATAWRDGLGSGLASGMGSAFGSVADGGGGPGGGAYAGAILGGASNLLSNMFYHHHQDIFLHPGTRMELQLDVPLVLPGGFRHTSNRYLPGTGPNTGIFVMVPLIDSHVPPLNQLRVMKKNRSGEKQNERKDFQ